MQRNYPLISSNINIQLTDITNLRPPILNRADFKLHLTPQESAYETWQRSSKSKDKQVVKGLGKAENRQVMRDSSYSKKYQLSKTERVGSHIISNFSNPTNDFSRQEPIIVNKTADFSSYLKKPAFDSNYSRSMKVSRQFLPSEIQQIKKNTERQSRFRLSSKNSRVQKDKLNFRQTSGSFSKQLKSTLNKTANNNASGAIHLPQRLRTQSSTSFYGQVLANKNTRTKEKQQSYTRHENTPSFLLNTQLNRSKRLGIIPVQNDNVQKPYVVKNVQNQGETTKTRKQRTRSQMQRNFLARSNATSNIQLLKNSSVVQPLTPQLRSPKRFQTYNFQKQKNSFSTYQSSFKKESTSSHSRLNVPRDIGFPFPKNSFSQASLVVEPLPISRQRDSLSSKQRQSIGSSLSLNDFQLGSVKGEGRFGKFYPVVHKKSGMLFGIKQIKKQSLKNMLDQFIQQLKIQSFIEHPNVVKLYGYFCSKQNFYLILEYMQQGTLFSYIKKNRKIKEQQTSTKLNQICSAVEYLHENQILHRDIKPQNIVMTCDVCKLCDFGWAVYSNTRRRTYCGTLDYVCPEILQGDSYDNCVDIWAVGVLAYEMIVGKAPFYNISRKQTMKKIMECDFQLPKQLGAKSKQFISNALNKNPNQRSSIADLAKHEFLN